VDAFTVGRGAELSEIETRLDLVKQGAARHVFLEGDYGTGKSHLLKAIESIALREGFAVSWVTLDGQNHPCNHPARYFHSFLENLRVSSPPTRGLASLVRQWLCFANTEALIDFAQKSESWLKYPVLEIHRRPTALGEAPYLNALLESRAIMFKGGKEAFQLVSERIAETAGLVRAAGFEGVVYLFDELETVATLLSSIRQRYLSYEFLNILTDRRKHPWCFFAFAATPDFGAKVEEDRVFRFSYAQEYPDGCRFIQKWNETALDVLQLKPIGRKYTATLCKLLRNYHGEAFSWKSQNSISDTLIERFMDEVRHLNMGTREAVRSFVQLLDICEQHRLANIESVLQWRKAAIRS
jgi:hypothetical protein